MMIGPLWRSATAWCGTLVFGLLCVSAADLSAETFVFHHENVLGTSLEIQIDAKTEADATAAEAGILAEIARLNAVFSRYDAASELSRWQSRVGESVQISPELFEVLAACDRWQAKSGGAFNPAVQALTQLWQAAEKVDRLPVAEDLAKAVRAIQEPQWSLSENGHLATRKTPGPLTLDAIAKGSIIDYASRAALARDGVESVVVNIGGDLRVSGSAVLPVGIADPRNDAENAPLLATIYVGDRGVATSGNYRRGFKVEGQWYSHLFDPRTGQPVQEIISSTAVAETAADADALATIFSVLSPAETAELAATLPRVDYLLVTRDGRILQSPGWAALTTPRLVRQEAAARQVALLEDGAQAKEEPKPAAESPAAEKSELLELTVKFELGQPEGAQYRRPYVAVWLEDSDNFPVRTSILWMQTRQPGPRWHRDLLRWFKNDGVRRLADERKLIGTISRATRGPGSYKAVFDGKDDAGQPLPPGEYTLYLEVARERGTYQLIRHPLKLGAEPIAETKLKSNVEVKSASVEYHAPAPAPAQPAGDK